MDPVGPWPAYASYNRLPGVHAGANANIHSQLTQSGASPTTTQVLPSGFLPSTAVGYETVFNPVFHPAGTKAPVQYVVQHRQVQAPGVKQLAEGEFQGQAYFEQTGGAWQQNSPFGVLPHESVTPTTTAGKSVPYENFNAHFAAAQSLNHLTSQLSSSNPKVTAQAVAKAASQPNSSSFYQVPATFSTVDSSNPKTFASDASSLQQTCIVTSANNASSKAYSIPQTSNRASFHSSATRQTPDKSSQPQIQTKAQTKIFPDLNNQDRQRTSHLDESQTQSPISFSIDAPGCLNYTNNNTAKRAQFQSSNYRHYQQGNNTETEFQRSKSSVEYSNSNGSECRRASPLQSHSQASPGGLAQSPVYPLYNSPMNSSSSPQQSTCVSPLDATISRVSSATSSYPSVITHALNDKKFPDHYDRTIQQQQDCWDERRSQQQRKYQSNNYVPINNMDMSLRMNEQCPPRNLHDRQVYFNNTGNQHPLQDIASCRDPLSLVKASSQIPQLEVKEPKIPNRRRKSNDKILQNGIPHGPVMPEYFAGRIPPPAHSSASNQQQNGMYFDRWNVPSSSAKMFAPQGVQHQGIVMNHPHPPLPYFPPFHLSAHPDYPPTVDLPTATYNEQPPQQGVTSQPNEEKDQPKVVVPNIEEELDFLSEGTTVTKVTNNTGLNSIPTVVNQVKTNDRTTGGVGFMHSYLKFLQGDRDSPPPAIRPKKQSWLKSKPVQPIIPQANGVLAVPQPPPPIPAARLSQGDPQDDPRYFPLPKERKKDCFDSSDDGFRSEDDLFGKKVSWSDFPKEKSFKRKKVVRPSGNSVRRISKKVSRPRKEKDFDEDNVTNVSTATLPRRETSRRAAKDKSSMKQLIEDDMEHEFIDSDSDPAWSPKRNEDNEVVAVMSKGRRVKNGGRRKQPRNLITAAAQCAGINDIDGYTSDGTGGSKIVKPIGDDPVREEVNILPMLDDSTSAAIPVPIPPISNPFQHGDFVVVKTDLIQEWPPIWRVDGKSLLQRYEPFLQDSQTLYKNVQTYTAWTPESIKQYTAVPISYKVQTPTEVIVEFIRKDMIGDVDFTVVEKSMDACKIYQDNFEVYIQTLISQALDSNFLTEILQEQDEYFLSNVKTIDDITDNQKNKMIYILQWPKAVLLSVSTWPCFNIMNEPNTSTNQIKACAACLRLGISVHLLMYGQPYNAVTLDECEVDPLSVEKDFLMCRVCANHAELYNKITHQKYLMYIQCSKKVVEKKNSDPSKDTTSILNELLADEMWLNKLFKDVRYSWAEVDCLEYRYKSDNQCSDSISDKTVL